MAKSRKPEIVDGFPFESSEIDKLVSEFEEDDGAKVSLMRLLPAKEGGGAAFLRDYDPVEFSQQVVKNEFGGGKYKIHIKHGRALLKQAMFLIDGPRVKYGEEIKREYPPQYHQNQPSSIEEKLERILESLDSRSSGDSSTELLKILLPFLLQRNEPQPKDSLEEQILGRLAQYKSLFSGAGVDAQTIFGAIKQGMEIVASSGGDGGSVSPWLIVAEKLLPMIQNVVTVVAQGQQKPGGQITPRLPGGQGQVSDQTKSPETAQPITGFGMIAPMLAPYIPAFVTAAAQDADPGFFIDMIVPNITIEQKPKVLEWLNGNEWLRDLTGLNPAISAQVGWWRDLRNELARALIAGGNGVQGEFQYGDDEEETARKTNA